MQPVRILKKPKGLLNLQGGPLSIFGLKKYTLRILNGQYKGRFGKSLEPLAVTVKLPC